MAELLGLALLFIVFSWHGATKKCAHQFRTSSSRADLSIKIAENKRFYLTEVFPERTSRRLIGLVLSLTF